MHNNDNNKKYKNVEKYIKSLKFDGKDPSFFSNIFIK